MIIANRDLLFPSGSSYLLDGNVPELCLSLEQLVSGVGDIITVRRSSDDAEADFSATEISDGTLVSWVGANDGFVTTWVNQGSIALSATQVTNSKQPKIVSSGSLITEGGKAALNFNSDDWMLISTNISSGTSNDYTFIRVLNKTNTGYVLDIQNGRLTLDGGSGWAYAAGSTGGTQLSTGQTIATIILDQSASSGTVYENGSAYGSSGSYTAKKAQSNIGIMGRFDGTSSRVSGNLQTLILYVSDQSANRSTIESGLNDIYSVY